MGSLFLWGLHKPPQGLDAKRLSRLQCCIMFCLTMSNVHLPSSGAAFVCLDPGQKPPPHMIWLELLRYKLLDYGVSSKGQWNSESAVATEVRDSPVPMWRSVLKRWAHTAVTFSVIRGGIQVINRSMHCPACPRAQHAPSCILKDLTTLKLHKCHGDDSLISDHSLCDLCDLLCG